MICKLCQSDKHVKVLSGSGFDDPDETFDLVRCEECGLVSVQPLLQPEQLSHYYGLSYYGGNTEAKFSKPAWGAVFSKIAVSPEKKDVFAATLKSKGRALLELAVDVHDEKGAHALAAVVEWFVARKT